MLWGTLPWSRSVGGFLCGQDGLRRNLEPSSRDVLPTHVRTPVRAAFDFVEGSVNVSEAVSVHIMFGLKDFLPVQFLRVVFELVSFAAERFLEFPRLVRSGRLRPLQLRL